MTEQPSYEPYGSARELIEELDKRLAKELLEVMEIVRKIQV